MDDHAHRVDAHRIGEVQIMANGERWRSASEVRKYLEPEPEISLWMLLWLVVSVGLVAVDTCQRCRRLDHAEWGESDRRSGEDGADCRGESPPRGQRRGAERDLYVERIPERGRDEDGAKHARLRGVECE